MAQNLNKVVVRGRLGSDLEVKQTSNGKGYARFSVANNQDYGDTKKTYWIDCVAWDPLASLMAKMVGKGCDIIVDGILAKSEWEKDGQKHSRMEVVVRNAEFITYKNDSAAKTEGTFTSSVEQDYEEYAYDPSEEF